ncbi:MAG: WecB/TagA/CpsF family glycosyltransferase [Terriglobia bacterium]|jgi:N-acetylglucosaminyldiphosphoundecaprenol N-acetyl-beta-D-mannosaminyltransferase
MPICNIPCARVLGVPVHVLGLQDVVHVIEGWLQNGAGGRWIAVTSSHGIMEGFKHREFRQVLESAALSVPDGKWTARAAAARLSLEPRQVRGADLMWELCGLANQRGYSSYFFGDTPEVLEQLTARLRGKFPNMPIAGAYSPPFRPLSEEENDEIIWRINDAKPHVLWVCLGLPKQERWIFANRHKLHVPIVIAVGAAAKFLSGSVAPAPRWIREHGFEWLWRLIREPRRCWRRSMLYGPQFALYAVLELSGVLKFES